jgi:hypothetical protein
MGMSGERGLNNWTPWIDSNWLSMVLVLERDPGRRQKAVYKIMRGNAIRMLSLDLAY